ncbi:MAG TPA: PHB depolymerase family esterase [Xanthomonadaceae bacterium]|nr:PHB depolymerase family esterase [Xanthomonadaceae bacterium]
MTRSSQRNAAAAFAIGLLASVAAPALAARPETAKLDVLSPLAVQEEIARRLLSPVQREQFERAVVHTHARIQAHTVTAGQETFDLSVPEAPAGTRYGLLVFVSPTSAFTAPREWRRELARQHLILIAARRSGNGENMLERRIPLALHAHAHATGRYPIDPERVYVAGFSGGARTAQILAFGYADVFRGVLQFAGSDPFGETAVPPPPEPLMELARERLRIVHVTGGADAANVAIDARTRRSLAALCVANVSQVDQPRLAHELPTARGFAKALEALSVRGATPRDNACRARLQMRIDADLQAVDDLLAANDLARARKRLGTLDLAYGWLAAPRSAALAQRLLAAEAASTEPVR